MLAISTLHRKSRFVLAAFLTLALSACVGGSSGNSDTLIDAQAQVTVALLVPSGSEKPSDIQLATALENAARLALADSGTSRINLRVYGTAGNPEIAGAAVRQAMTDGAKIILGPVFSAESEAVAAIAARRGVNVLSFSNNASIAGGNLFILGTTYQGTAERLARFAVTNSLDRFVTVAEKNPQGVAGSAAIDVGVREASGVLVGQVSYPFSQAGVLTAPTRISEAVERTQANVLFLTADTAGALPLLSQILPENGLTRDKVQLIGLTRWDIPRATLTLPGLQGAWFALPDPEIYTRYQAHYQQAYGTVPHPISGLAYDGVSAIAALLDQPVPTSFNVQTLTQPLGFVGVNGIFRFLPNGLNERALAIGQIDAGEVTIISPAPRTFSVNAF